MSELEAERLRSWRQTPTDRIPDPDAAASFIERVGIATLYPVSPEVPNLFHGYLGDPNAKTDSGWDTPSGHIYTWRWELGRPEAAFYSTLVRKRPTWVSWDLLPAILRLRGESRTPDELSDLAVISPAAYRITQALEASGGVLSTGELRRQAGFPTGKEQRAAYLKAIDELDSRLLLAKVFSPDDQHDMSHALVAIRYREHVDAADRMTCEEAFDRFLRTYLPNAVYTRPTLLARHMRLDEENLRQALERLVAAGTAEPVSIEGQKGSCYRWMSEWEA